MRQRIVVRRLAGALGAEIEGVDLSQDLDAETVAALPGQHVKITDHVVVDGRSLAASVVRKADGEGRTITPYPGGVVPPGHFFLHSSFASSYDSRYFGPVPDSGLLGLARPILTFDP